MPEDRLGRAAVLPRQLAESGAVRQGVERLGEQGRAAQPVVGAEGLLGEVAPAVPTVEALDAVRGALSCEEAGACPAPRSRIVPVRWTVLVGTERGCPGCGARAHA